MLILTREAANPIVVAMEIAGSPSQYAEPTPKDMMKKTMIAIFSFLEPTSIPNSIMGMHIYIPIIMELSTRMTAEMYLCLYLSTGIRLPLPSGTSSREALKGL